MKFTKAILIILIVASVSNCLVYATAETDTTPTTEPTESITTSADAEDALPQGYQGIDAGSAYLGTRKLVENVGAAFLYEVNSDTLLYMWNADDRVYPSSLVKIMTALLAAERGDMQSVVTVSQSALDDVPYYAASAELQPDEQITLSDLMYCMMVGSANDAAVVIAEHISGSHGSFVQEMNDYAASIGCTDTNFVNAHGLHDENQYTTARDLAKILSVAVKNETFMTYFSAIAYSVPATNKAEIRNLSSSNFLMSTAKLQKYYDTRVKGGRTGIADDDSRCLATVAEANGMQVVCLVLESFSTLAEDGRTESYGSFLETSTLLDACFGDNRVVQVICEDQVLMQVPAINGENDVILATASGACSILPANIKLENLTFKYDDSILQPSAPISAGQVISNVEIWYNGSRIAKTDLVAKNAVRYVESTATPDQTKDDSPSAFAIIGYVVVGVGLLLLSLRGIRYLRLVLEKKKAAKTTSERKKQ